MSITEIFSLPYMQNGLLAAIMIGISCSVTGPFVISRRIIFVGMVVSQLAVLGVAAGTYFALESGAKFALTLTFALLGVVLMGLTGKTQKIPPDAFLGMGFAGSYALAMLMLAKSTQGLEEIHHLMSGNLLSVTDSELRVLALITAAIVILHILAHRPFVFVCLDKDFAQVSGKKTWLWEALFFLGLALTISVSLHLTGLYYVFSCLVFPGVAGLILARRVGIIQLTSVVFAIGCAVAGVWFSFVHDFPTSESIMSFHIAAVLSIAIFASIKKRFFGGEPAASHQ